MNVFRALNHLINIILIFLAEPGLPRSIVIKMVKLFGQFFKFVILKNLKNDVLKALEHKDPKQKIDECFKSWENVFEYVDSQKK